MHRKGQMFEVKKIRPTVNRIWDLSMLVQTNRSRNRRNQAFSRDRTLSLWGALVGSRNRACFMQREYVQQSPMMARQSSRPKHEFMPTIEDGAILKQLTATISMLGLCPSVVKITMGGHQDCVSRI